MYFIINLALADLLKVAIDLPMPAVSSMHGKWVFGKLGCDFYGWTSGLFGFVSITTLALMAIERYSIMRETLKAASFSRKAKLSKYSNFMQ
jgi:c-opsin